MRTPKEKQSHSVSTREILNLQNRSPLPHGGTSHLASRRPIRALIEVSADILSPSGVVQIRELIKT